MTRGPGGAPLDSKASQPSQRVASIIKHRLAFELPEHGLGMPMLLRFAEEEAVIACMKLAGGSQVCQMSISSSLGVSTPYRLRPIC